MCLELTSYKQIISHMLEFNSLSDFSSQITSKCDTFIKRPHMLKSQQADHLHNYCRNLADENKVIFLPCLILLTSYLILFNLCHHFIGKFSDIYFHTCYCNYIFVALHCWQGSLFNYVNRLI